MSGLPPSYVRVFAWLVVCEPPHQSAADLRQSLGLSAGAVSMATATLEQIGLVERVRLDGERRHYYRVRADGWEHAIRLRLESVTGMRRLAEETLGAANGDTTRLAGMRDMYAWFEDRMSEFLREGVDPAAGRSSVGQSTHRRSATP